MTRPLTIEVPENEPFQNCKLDRKPYSKVLTDIIRTNTDGFVLAIDNKWGAGKTTFISMWKQHMENEGFQTLSFNAWENDFENNPFVALTAELKTLLKNEKSKTFKEVLKKGSKIAQAIIPSAIKSAVKRYAGEDAGEIMENYSKGVLESFKEDIESYIERKQTLSEFRNELEKYIQENSNGKPIVFIIDELDRCRPNYAVTILENIKHLFSVKGIIFVLSIDKEQLRHAVCGVYGSDKIDSDEYLRRFIDIEYSLPEPQIEKYISHLVEVSKLTDFFNLPNRKTNNELVRDTTNFIKYAKFLFELKNPTLRQQEKLIRHIAVVFRSFDGKQYIVPELLIFLTYVRLFENQFYVQLRRRELTHQTLLNKCAEILDGNTSESAHYYRINIEAMILTYYNEYLDHDKKISIDSDMKNEDFFEIQSIFDLSTNQAEFKRCIRAERNNYHRHRTSIEYLLKKIDLFDPLTIT